MESAYLPFSTQNDGDALNAKVVWSKSGRQNRGIALVFHGGGWVVGSAEMIPAPQVQYLVDHNFVVVIPNYSLSPQVSASEGAFVDADMAFRWARYRLPKIYTGPGAIDSSKVVVMGHSGGGTLALHLAAKYPRTVTAVAAFYPSLYISDLSSSAHQPCSAFSFAPDFQPTPENLDAVFRPGKQLSEFPMGRPGAPMPPRNVWQLDNIKKGTFMKAVQPDENYAAIDPCTQFARQGKVWPSTIFIQGDKDTSPGSSLAAVERAAGDLKSAGAPDVKVVRVEGESHMFDIPPTVGTSDLGPKWLAVKKGLDFLVEHVDVNRSVLESAYFPFSKHSDGSPLNAKVIWSKNGSASRGVALVFHGGGWVIGSAEMIPPAQIQYLVDHDFVVVIPNYRLSPQVSASEGAFVDAEMAFRWVRHGLAQVPNGPHGVDSSKVVVMGHSGGGTLALHIAATYPYTVRAVGAFYPSLYISDLSSSAHQPCAAFSSIPDFQSTDANLDAVFRPGKQITEFPLARPGGPMQPRNLWQMSHVKNGTFMKAVQPDEKYALIDPSTQFSKHGKVWPATIFIQGDKDTSPGSSVDTVNRAVSDLKRSGATEVKAVVVEGESHMFDLLPTVGTTDLGPKWQAVKKGLDYLVEHIDDARPPIPEGFVAALRARAR